MPKPKNRRVKIQFLRLHRFSRLPLKKPIAVPKQKPKALFHLLRFFFFDRLHDPSFQSGSERRNESAIIKNEIAEHNLQNRQNQSAEIYIKYYVVNE